MEDFIESENSYKERESTYKKVDFTQLQSGTGDIRQDEVFLPEIMHTNGVYPHSTSLVSIK